MNSTIKPTTNNILFQFTDEVRGGMFFDVEKSGIVVGKSNDMSAKTSRWGKVIAVGPDVSPDEVKVGQNILIEALRWTESFTVDGQKYWFTRVPEVMCVED